MPIVVFRNDGGEAGALLDRCPHRNVPLSLGKVQAQNLECAYHGWQFDRRGVCQQVPGVREFENEPERRVPAFAVREQDGFVWIYATPDEQPAREPFRFPLLDDKTYTTVRHEVQAAGSIHAVAENALDVPHTAYLHGGLFRKAEGKKHDIEVIVRRWHDRVEAEYVGEPRPEGLAGRVLAPQGGMVQHYDRFILPSITQVEYRLSDKNHICVTAALTPVSDFQTRLFAVISFRLPLPGWLIALFLKPLALRIFKQDAGMLQQQTATIQQFGGEQFFSSDVDVLGAHIYRLLRQAERGEREPLSQPIERHLRMAI